MPKITMVKKGRQFPMLVCVLLLITLLLPVKQVQAEEYACTVSIPVKLEISGFGEEAKEEFEVVLSGGDADVPMPEQSVWKTGEGGAAEFGPISYTVPGEYQYRISQKIGGNSDISYDGTVYTVTVRVLNKEGGGLAAEVWAQKANFQGKMDEISFLNEYKMPESETEPETETEIETTGETHRETEATQKNQQGNTPKTGDPTRWRLWGSLLALSLFGMIAVILERRSVKHHKN